MYGNNAGPPISYCVLRGMYASKYSVFLLIDGMVVIGSVIHNRRYVCFIIASMLMIHNRWYVSNRECDS